jgi:hypothetical protein
VDVFLRHVLPVGAHGFSVGWILVRFHPGRILGSFSAGDAPSLFRMEGDVRIERDIHPDDNFEPERGLNWPFLIFWLTYGFFMGFIAKSCVF